MLKEKLIILFVLINIWSLKANSEPTSLEDYDSEVTKCIDICLECFSPREDDLQVY
jgi:hypothetical protein